MAGQWELIDGPAGSLAVHDVGAKGAGAGSSSVVLVCHDFPVVPHGAAEAPGVLVSLAERLAADVGWRATAGCLRGVGGSAGNFSLAGWLDDLHVLVDHAVELASGGGVWVVGFGASGALALCATAADGRLRGVAALGAPATFADWAGDVGAMVQFARRVGVVHTLDYPADERLWADAFDTVRPVDAAPKVAPRPVLLIHGVEDDEIPVADARALADAAGTAAELYLLPGAGHHLRADPRAMAVLTGWLERQRP